MMTRMSALSMLAAAILSASIQADVEVAPLPREIRPDGSRDAAPQPETAPEDPAATVDRIIKNSRAVSDQLAATEISDRTRSTQDRILKDIEALINRQEDSKSGNKSDQKNDQSNKDQKNSDKDPSGGMKPMDGMQPKEGPAPKGGMEPKDGKNQATSGHRPRKGSEHPKEPGRQGIDMGMASSTPMPGKPDPKPGGAKASQPKDSKDPKGGLAAGNPKSKADNTTPALPINDNVVKEVWGHLPDKLRQQVTQYYREEFMPRYAELLKQYYSSLANSPPRPPEMRLPERPR